MHINIAIMSNKKQKQVQKAGWEKKVNEKFNIS